MKIKIKNIAAVASIGVALLGSANLAVADTNVDRTFKVGTVESKLLLELSPQAKAAQERIEREFKPRQESLSKRESALKDKMDLYERDKSVISEKEKVNQERDISRLQQELQRLGQELGYDVQTKQREELERFHKLMEKAVENVAKKNSLNVVIPSHLAIYSTDGADITKQVLKALEEMNKKG